MKTKFQPCCLNNFPCRPEQRVDSDHCLVTLLVSVSSMHLWYPHEVCWYVNLGSWLQNSVSGGKFLLYIFLLVSECWTNAVHGKYETTSYITYIIPFIIFLINIYTIGNAGIMLDIFNILAVIIQAVLCSCVNIPLLFMWWYWLVKIRLRWKCV